MATLNLRIAGWAQALGLGGWEIAYSPKPPNGDAPADDGEPWRSAFPVHV